MRFIKVKDLKLTQFELFSFLHFKNVAANVTELFSVALKAKNERFFFTIQTFNFKYQILYTCELASLS